MSSNISTILTQLVSLARFAPSSHNTQPWSVQIDELASAITIGYDTQRRLTVGDPDNRELFLTLGCFIETLICAASDNGLQADYKFLSEEPDRVAHIIFKPAPATKATDKWAAAIRNRRSDRRLYDKKALTPQIVSELSSIARGNATLRLINNQPDIVFLAEMTEQATLSVMSSNDFRNELASWVRHNYTRQSDGMPAYTQEMPGPVSLLAPWLIRNMKPVPADQAKKDAKRVSHSAAIGLVCTPEQSVGNWIDAGRVYQAACLYSTQHSIKTAGVSAAIIEKDTAAAIIKQLKLSQQPVALLRFGYKDGQVRSTPRRRVADFTTY